MAEIVYTFRADDSDLQSSIQRSISNIQQLGKDGNHSVQEVNDAYKSLGQQIAQSMDKAGLKQLTADAKAAEQEANRLGKELRSALDENGADRTSASIQELQKRFADATRNANAYQQVLQSVQQSMQSMPQQQSGPSFLEGLQQKAAEATKGMADIKSAIDLLPGPLQGVGNKVLGVVQSFKMMAKIPLLAVISALVSAFQALDSFMHSTTQTGTRGLQDLQNKATALNKVTSIFKATVAAIQNIAYKTGEALTSMLESPKQSMEDFAKWCKKFVMDKLDALMTMTKGLGKMLSGLFSMDATKLNEGMAIFGEGWRKNLDSSIIGQVAKAIASVAKETDNLQDKIKALEDRKVRLQVEKINWRPIEAGLDEKIRNVQTKIYEETDDQKKAKAIEEAQSLIAEKYAKRLELAKEELRIQQEQMKLTPSTIEDFEKEAELKANLVQLEAQRLQEGMRLTRMMSAINKTAHEKEIANARELEKLYLTLDKERLEAQKDSIDKSIALIEQETRERKVALEEQVATWRKNSPQAILSEEQEAYYIEQSQWIDEEAERKKQEALIKTYETTANKFRELAAKYSKDINSLQDQGSKDVATEQLNRDALSLVQNDSKLKGSFAAWQNTLSDMTIASLQSQIDAAEKMLSDIEDQTSEEAMVLRAQIETMRQAAIKTQEALRNKKPAEQVKNLNSQLKNCATSLRALGEETDGNFGEVTKVLADAIELTSTLIDSWQTMTESIDKLSNIMQLSAGEAVEGIKEGTKTAANGIESTERSAVAAIKSMETASVILAIVGAIMQAAQAMAKLFKSRDYMDEVREDVKKVNREIEKMNTELDLSRNKQSSMFGDNPWGSFIESTKDAQRYLAEFNSDLEDISNRNIFSGFGAVPDMFKKSWSEVAGETADGMTGIEKAFASINDMSVKVQHATWLRSAKYKSIGDLGYDIMQKREDGSIDQEASIEALKKFKESDYYDKLGEENRDLIDSMIDDWDAYQTAVEQMTDSMKDYFSGITDAFGDAMVNAFETGEDAAMAFRTNVGDTIRSMVKDMLISKYITSYFDEAAESITKMESSPEWQKMTDEGQANYIADEIIKASDKALGQLDGMSEVYGRLDDRLSEMGFLSTAEANANTLSGAISGASQESIDLLSGYCNAVRIQQVESIDILRQQLITMSGVESNTAQIASSCGRILNHLEGQVTEGESLRASGL